MKQDTQLHETCKCKFRLGASVCNNKQRGKDDKCRCECKELIDKGMRDKGFIWTVDVNVINYVMLESIQIKKIVNLEKGWLTNLFKNVLKLLMRLKWQKQL